MTRAQAGKNATTYPHTSLPLWWRNDLDGGAGSELANFRLEPFLEAEKHSRAPNANYVQEQFWLQIYWAAEDACMNELRQTRAIHSYK